MFFLNIIGAIGASGTTPDLQAVTNIGYTTDNEMVSENPGISYSKMQQGSLVIGSGSDDRITLTTDRGDGLPVIRMYSAATAAKWVDLFAGTVVGNFQQNLQDANGTIALIADIEATGAVALTFINSWSAIAGVFLNQVQKTPFGLVILQICAQSGGTNMCTSIPAGYRPPGTICLGITYLDGTFKNGFCYVDSGGVVFCQNSGGGLIPFGSEVYITLSWFAA